MDQLRKIRRNELLKVSEFVDRSNFVRKTLAATKSLPPDLVNTYSNALTNSFKKDFSTILDAGLLSYLLHCEARVASYFGKGFYTIGPCGEELMGSISCHIESFDAAAFHYRHVANSVVRQIRDGKSLDDIALQRARGFAVSTRDPVTGGRHCSIGGNFRNEFLVTSTLASQAPPAVGRALAIPLANKILGPLAFFKRNSVSYVSIGEGSATNAHFLSAFNMARYSEHSKVKCPVVFVISDNKKCISLKGNGWIDKFVDQIGSSMYHNQADGSNALDIYLKSKEAIDYSRTLGRPSLLLVNNLPRRFGHAATDRQDAYMSKEEIALETERNPLSTAFSIALATGHLTEADFVAKFESSHRIVENAFDLAVQEPKITSRKELVDSNSQPLVPLNGRAADIHYRYFTDPKNTPAASKGEPMRKNMTRVIEEVLSADEKIVYIGEDVEHGGYYLVTDGLHAKFPLRIRNFPPDETALVGAAIGFSQCGLIPILEIPYLKYLDCASDMFYEAIIANWLSNSKQPNGMVIRIQGFDKGIFGGNFHTHNMLPIVPGLDVVCFSNGGDYVKGMRYAVKQARGGRVVMLVDSTDLLNRRHLVDDEKDEKLLCQYAAVGEEMSFEEIVVYPSSRSSSSASHSGSSPQAKQAKVAIVSYGNGVPTSLIAQRLLETARPSMQVSVVDCPYLSAVPEKLEEFIRQNDFDVVVFADVCKEGAGMPLGGHALTLQKKGVLSNKKWSVIGAAATYNPLGCTVTFLNADDIVKAVGVFF